MTSELITWPLRVSFGATRIALRGTVKAARLTGELAGEAVKLVWPPPGMAARDRDAPPQRAQPPGAQGQGPRLGPAATEAPPAPTSPAEPETRPAEPETRPADAAEPPAGAAEPHIEAEAELVAEFAEPGAEDGAGPELHVREPWDGYGQLDAHAVIDRIAAASGAELALVELYEQAHKQRQTVLEAVERRLRSV
jgi:hypothetical protein